MKENIFQYVVCLMSVMYMISLYMAKSLWYVILLLLFSCKRPKFMKGTYVECKTQCGIHFGFVEVVLCAECRLVAVPSTNVRILFSQNILSLAGGMLLIPF